MTSALSACKVSNMVSTESPVESTEYQILCMMSTGSLEYTSTEYLQANKSIHAGRHDVSRDEIRV